MSQDIVDAGSRERSSTSAQAPVKTLLPSDGMGTSLPMAASRRRKPGQRRANPVCPRIPSLMRYRDRIVRIVRVVAEARGQRVIIESVDDKGGLHKSPVKWTSLDPCGEQLF